MPKLILGAYGTEVVGAISSITQITSYFSILEAGLSQALVSTMYKSLIDDDKDTINGLLGYSRKFYNKVSVLLICFIGILALVYPLSMNRGQLEYPFLSALCLILGASGIVDFLSVKKYSILLTADKKYGVIQIAMGLQLLARCLVIFALIQFGVSVLVVQTAAMATIVIIPSVLGVYCRRHYPYLAYCGSIPAQTIPGRYDALIHQVASLIQSSAPIIIASFFLPLSEVGILSFYFMVLRGVDMLLSLVSVSIPNFGHMYAKKDINHLSFAFGQLELVYCFFCVVLFSVMTVNFEPFIWLFSGYTIDHLAIFCTVYGLLLAIRRPHMILLNSAGLYRYTRPYALIQTALLLGVSVLLCQKLGIVGILIGLILSNIYRDLETLVHIPGKIGLKMMSSAKKWLTVLGCFGVLSCLLPWLRDFFPAVDSYRAWVAFSALTTALSAGIALLAFLMTDRKLCLAVWKTKIAPFLRVGLRDY